MNETAPIEPEIRELIDQRRWRDLRGHLSEMPAPDIAELLLEMDAQERIFLFRILPRRLSSEVFSYLGAREKDALLTDLTNEETGRLLAGLSPDDRTDFLQELPGQVIQRLLNLLSASDRREALLLLGYPEESVGRIMTPDYVAVREEWPVERALKHMRSKGRDSETINVVYVVDSEWKLLDALDLRKFILADPGLSVRDIMDYTFASVSAYDDREDAVRMIQHYDLVALPVVDTEGVLLGIVTVDDVLDVAQAEATEDFHMVAAVSPLKTSYRESSVWSLYAKRIVWLGALIFVSLISSGVISAYEETLSASIALAFFIPLLIASGGNAGAQSATLMIRAIATDDVKTGQWLWAVGREIGVSVLLGTTMGMASWALGVFRGGWKVGITVGLAMVIIVVVSNIIGVILPFLLTRFRFDPAMASSPLITSIADAVGLLIYFNIATWILGTP